ncbi:MAG: MFS transporter [Ilumatobacteraceae bacterium]
MRSPSTSPAGASVESSESDRPGASEGRAGTFVSLRVRNFRLYFVGQMISQTGTWLTTIAQTLLVLRLNGTGLVLGALGVAQFGPMLLLAWAGAIADRAPKRKLLITIQSLSMAVAVTLGVVTLAGHATLGVVRRGVDPRDTQRSLTLRAASRSSPRWCPTSTTRTP